MFFCWLDHTVTLTQAIFKISSILCLLRLQNNPEIKDQQIETLTKFTPLWNIQITEKKINM